MSFCTLRDPQGEILELLWSLSCYADRQYRSSRKRTIQAMLARNAPKIDEWMTAGLVGSLRLPTSWVDEAKVKLLTAS